jgi:hypothetical protein
MVAEPGGSAAAGRRSAISIQADCNHRQEKIMGALVEDPHVPGLQTLLNNRFAPGDAIKEMVALQKEFKVFEISHSLRSIARLINVVPTDSKARASWLKYIGHLKDVPSETQGVSAHDRIIMALKENLESKSFLPVWFGWHVGTKLTVTRDDQPLVFSKTKYLRISVPVLHA